MLITPLTCLLDCGIDADTRLRRRYADTMMLMAAFLPF